MTRLTKIRRSYALALIAIVALVAAACSGTSEDPGAGQVEVAHYYGSDLGQQGILDVNATFEAGEAVVSPIEHEAFKDQILVALAGGEPPDVFSYWAGARTQSVFENGHLQPITQVFDNADVWNNFPQALVDAGIHGGEPHLLPFGFHYVAFFYNPHVMAAAGVTSMPTNSEEFFAAAEQIADSGVKPIALGSMNRWPAQFWFDFLILRTAGPEYRAKLMSGEASYTDPEVVAAMELWKDLADAGFFVDDANAYTWTDAADQVANGEAAMTLMGTWITGYWNGIGLEPVTDYDFFNFPVLDPSIENAALGPIDGWALSADAANPEGAMLLLEHYADPGNQLTWALEQGALPPNSNADTTQLNPVMAKALVEVGKADSYSFNYDLATPPPVAEVGLDMFQAFMDDPSGYADLLSSAQSDAQAAFAG